MPNKNNPDGTRVQIGCLVEAELFEEFDEIVQSKCLKKTAVLRKLIKDFVKTRRFTTEEG